MDPGDRACVLCCGTSFNIIFFVAHVIIVGISWNLSDGLYSGNSMTLAALTLTTIPMFAVIIFFWINKTKEYRYRRCAFLFAGVCEWISVILFIIAGADLKDKSSIAMACGISTGVFSIIAGLASCCSVFVVGY